LGIAGGFLNYRPHPFFCYFLWRYVPLTRGSSLSISQISISTMSAWLSRKVSAFTIHDVDGSNAQKEAINAIAKEFEVSTENLRTIVKQFNEDMDKGLQRHGATG
jgi:hypothetical protein